MAGQIINKSMQTVLYDGNCNLCNNVARFIIRNDSRKIFNCVPFGSDEASDFLPLYDKKDIPKGSMLLIKDEKIYMKSDAVFRILKCLDGLWPVLYIFIVVPRFIRDPVYDIIAKYRYRWFGVKDDSRHSVTAESFKA